MKKTLLLLAVSFLAVKLSVSQDLIIKNTGDTIKGQILEVTDDVIRYKKANNPDGPTFVTNKYELNKVIFANGTEEKFDVQAPTQPAIRETPAKPTEPNIDTRTQGGHTEKSTSSGFEKIAIEPFGYYYKGVRMNENRLLHLYRSFGDASILKEFKSAKANKTASTITGIVSIPFAVGGVILSIISFIPVEDYDNATNEYVTSRPYSNLLVPGIAMFAGFIGLQVTSIVLKSTHKAKLKKTVNHYNSVIAKHELK